MYNVGIDDVRYADVTMTAGSGGFTCHHLACCTAGRAGSRSSSVVIHLHQTTQLTFRTSYLASCSIIKQAPGFVDRVRRHRRRRYVVHA